MLSRLRSVEDDGQRDLNKHEPNFPHTDHAHLKCMEHASSGLLESDAPRVFTSKSEPLESPATRVSRASELNTRLMRMSSRLKPWSGHFKWHRNSLSA